MNFYIWLVLTIVITAYAWVVIARWARGKRDD